MKLLEQYAGTPDDPKPIVQAWEIGHFTRIYEMTPKEVAELFPKKGDTFDYKGKQYTLTGEESTSDV